MSMSSRLVRALMSCSVIFLATISLLQATSSAQEVGPVLLTRIELVTVGTGSASVTWNTNLPSDTRVQWGLSEELGSETIDTVQVRFHMGKLMDLEPGTHYYYRIGSGGRWGPLSNLTTLIPPDGEVVLTLALFTDCHYDADGRNSANGNMYGDGPELLGSMVSELNDRADIDAVFILGDLTNGAEEDLSGSRDALDDLRPPWYPMPGNHDKSDGNWTALLGTYWGRERTYYSLDEAGYHLVVLDSATGSTVNGNLTNEQLSWLESDLSINEDAPTLVFMHHEMSTDPIFGIEEEAHQRLEMMLRTRSNVLGIFTGHNHRNSLNHTSAGRVLSTIASSVQYPIGYSILELRTGGFTQSFNKVASSLETSEESRMLLITSSADTGIDQEYLGPLKERNFAFEIPENKAPTIVSVRLDPATVGPEEEALVLVDAFDPDGDSLSYRYEVSGGSISGSGPSATWTAPEEGGEYILTLTVSDGHLESEPARAALLVVEGDDLDNSPPLITSVVAEKRVLAPGGRTGIIVSASDPDLDDLTYSYEAEEGDIIGSGRSVEWQAPNSTGKFLIRVRVHDGRLWSEGSSVEVEVRAKVEGKVEESAPGIGEGFILLSAVGFALLLYIDHRRRHRT